MATIGYKDGRLVKASVSQSTNQSTEIKKYVAGELQEDLNMPSSVSPDWDLVNLIQGSKPREDGAATARGTGPLAQYAVGHRQPGADESRSAQLRSAQLIGAKELKTR